MKTLIKMTTANVKMYLCSWTFVVCCIGLALMGFADHLPLIIHNTVRNAEGHLHVGGAVVEMVEMNATFFWMVQLCICATAGACIYCDHRKEQMLNQILVRSSRLQYVVSIFFASAVIGFLCMALGKLILVGIESTFIPFLREGAVYDTPLPLLRAGKVIPYMVLLIIQSGLKGAFFSMLSLMLSVIVENKFMIITLPSLLYYFLVGFGYFYLGEAFDFINLQLVYERFMHGTEIKSVLFALGYTILAGALFGLLFYRILRRRMG